MNEPKANKKGKCIPKYRFLSNSQDLDTLTKKQSIFRSNLEYLNFLASIRQLLLLLSNIGNDLLRNLSFDTYNIVSAHK